MALACAVRPLGNPQTITRCQFDPVTVRLAFERCCRTLADSVVGVPPIVRQILEVQSNASRPKARETHMVNHGAAARTRSSALDLPLRNAWCVLLRGEALSGHLRDTALNRRWMPSAPAFLLHPRHQGRARSSRGLPGGRSIVANNYMSDSSSQSRENRPTTAFG